MRRAAVLPSLLTMGNYVCGLIAIIFCAWGLVAQHNTATQVGPEIIHSEQMKVESTTTIKEKIIRKELGLAELFSRTNKSSFLIYACVIIFLSMIFDMLDGKVARMTGSSSHFGGELDSLADACSFGAAPAMIITTHWMINAPETAAWYGQVMACAIAYACLAVLRLARFNVELTPAEKGTFKGLPSPAAAGALVSMVLIIKAGYGDFIFNWLSSFDSFGTAGQLQARFFGFYALFLGLLMVSWRLKYAHATNRLFRKNKQWAILVGIVVLFTIFLMFPEEILFLGFNGYVLIGLFYNLRSWYQGKKQLLPSSTVLTELTEDID